MKKIAVGLFFVVLAVLTIQPVQATDVKTLAIIDTAIDSNKIPQVVYEACFTDSGDMACPNGSNFMEGKGSAASPIWPSSMLNKIYHGHNVVKTALVANPNINIVFIRISDITITGGKINTSSSLVKAIDWISNNSDRLKINAVSISQASNVNKKFLSDPKNAESYNKLCLDKTTTNSVASLNNKNIPIFAATGNAPVGEGGNLTMVGFPACVSGVVGVGALSGPRFVDLYKSTNRGNDLNVVAKGDITIINYAGNQSTFTATSAATPTAAATFLSKNNILFNDYILKLNKVLGYPYITN